MKKTILALSLIAFAATLISCSDKEGYNPDGKISEVYTSSKQYVNDTLAVSVPNTLTQRWTWDEKKLAQIEHFEESYDGPHSYIETFTYDKKGYLTGTAVANIKSTFEYDGKYLKNVSIYEDNQFSSGMTFEHDGNKITKITMIQTDYKTKMAEFNPLRLIVSPEIYRTITRVEKVALIAAKKHGIKNQNLVFNVTWDGQNVSKLSGSIPGSSTYTINYTYDNKKNPFKDFYNYSCTDNEGFTMLSRNNIVRYTTSVADMNDTTTYTYIYNDDDMPATRTEVYISNDESYRLNEETQEWELIGTSRNRSETTESYSYKK
jgi:hypothetical protein